MITKFTIKNTLVLTLTFSILLGFVCGCAVDKAYAANSTIIISHVDITGVTPPEIGELPTFDGICVTQKGVYIDFSNTHWNQMVGQSVCWYDPANPFENGESYLITVCLYPNYGYTFADEMTATVNGKNATKIDKVGEGLLSRCIYYIFDPLSDSPADGDVSINRIISHVDITGVTPPAVGELPTFEGIGVTQKGVYIDPFNTHWLQAVGPSYYWHDPANPFENGEPYSITVHLYPNYGYTFADEMTATVNGKNATKIDMVGEGLISRDIFYSFAPLSDSPSDGDTPSVSTFSVILMNGDEKLKEYAVEKGKEFTIPEDFEPLIKRGYYFSGWTSNGNPVGNNFVVEVDTVLEAQFEKLPKLSDSGEKVEIVDVIILLQYVNRMGPLADLPFDEVISKGVDFNKDGKIDIVDVIFYLKSI